MLRIGRRQRVLAGTIGHVNRPVANGGVPSDPGQGVVRGYKSRRGYVQDEDGVARPGALHESLHGRSVEVNRVTATGSFGGFGGSGGSGGGGLGGLGSNGGFGGANATVDRFNPIYDDLSRGTVAEDWIPRDPRLQNRMFRIMFARGVIEGPVVETISEMCWSDFDLAGIADQQILDTYWAAKDAVRVDRYLEDITREYLVIGRVVVQLILDAQAGIWSDMVIHDADYLDIGPIPRTGYMPKIDLLPSPELQEWVKSQDERDIESREGMSKELLDALAQNQPIPLDPATTAYLPRRSYFNDVFGTSFFVRNIPLWGLEKSLINATLTGHRRRAGPITQIAVGSEQWEPTPEQIDALVAAYTAAEEDAVSSTIGTRYDVQFNQIRGSLAEMWKWQDEWSFLQEAKLKMFGVSESLIMGDLNIDTTTAPTIFMERLKAHRKYIVETFLIQKFFRGLAVVHNFRRRSEAELKHRIIVNDDEHELILPTLIFHKSLDTTADIARADLLDKMQEVGLPVGMSEWNRTLGGGELADRMRTAVEDLEFRLQAMKFQQLKQQILILQEGAGDTDNLEEEVKKLAAEVEKLDFAEDEDGYDVNKLTSKEKKKAKDMSDGVVESASFSAGLDPSQVYKTTDTRMQGPPRDDLARNRAANNRDPETLSRPGKAV